VRQPSFTSAVAGAALRRSLRPGMATTGPMTQGGPPFLDAVRNPAGVIGHVSASNRGAVLIEVIRSPIGRPLAVIAGLVQSRPIPESET